MVTEKPFKKMDKNQDKTTGLYKIAAKIFKKVKSGSSYKTQLYQAQYPNKLSLNAVLMNVFKWEKAIDVLVEKSNILEKENNMDRDLVYVLITEMMWSKFGLKGTAKNILAIKKYKVEFLNLMKENDLEKLSTATHTKGLKPRFFRVNTLLTTLEKMLEKLSELKFIKLKSPKSYAEFLELIKSDKFKGRKVFVQDVHIKELLVFNSNVKFYEIEEYNNGSLIVQDKASCLAAYLLRPESNSTVLDMCAAPGMKTSHLAAIMQNTGKLYAVDRCKDRFNIMQNMLEKYGVQNVETFNMDALTFPYYDDVKYILLDPSCSGSGIVDRVRNDSSGQNQNFQTRLKKLANVHAQLLNHALKSYPKLERLVYSTCSANHEENEAVVDEALSVNGKFKLLDATKIVKGWTNKGAPGYDCSEMCLNAVPSVDCTNGFFIAVFVRRDLEENEVAEEEENIEDNEVAEEEENIENNENIKEENNIENNEDIKEENNIENNEDIKEENNIENNEDVKQEKNIENNGDVKQEEVVEDMEVDEEEKVIKHNAIVDKKVKKVKKSSISCTDKNVDNTPQVKKRKYIEDNEVFEEEKVIAHTGIVNKKVKKIKKSSISNTDKKLKNKSQNKKNKNIGDNEVVEEEENIEDNEVAEEEENIENNENIKEENNIENNEDIKEENNIENNEDIKEENNIENNEDVKQEKNIENNGDVKQEEVVEDMEVDEEEKVIKHNAIVDKKVKKVKKSSISCTDKNVDNTPQVKKRKYIEDNEVFEEEKVIAHTGIVNKKVKKIKKSSISNTDKKLKNKSQNKKNKNIGDNEVVEEKKVIAHTEIVDKKVKTVNKPSISNTDKNLENKSQNIKQKNKNIESTPLVKSKNAKRRERRLKLEKANKTCGLQTAKTKKQKKVKTET